MKTETQFPPAPPAYLNGGTIAQPKKRRHWLLALAGVALVVGLAVLGLLTNVDQYSTGTQAPVETETTVQEAAIQASPLVTEAASEFQLAYTAVQAGDAGAMVDHTNAAADLYEEVGSIFDGVDNTIAGYFHSAADHLYRSTSYVSDGDYSSAIVEIRAAGRALESATTYMNGLT